VGAVPVVPATPWAVARALAKFVDIPAPPLVDVVAAPAEAAAGLNIDCWSWRIWSMRPTAASKLIYREHRRPPLDLESGGQDAVLE